MMTTDPSRGEIRFDGGADRRTEDPGRGSGARSTGFGRGFGLSQGG